MKSRLTLFLPDPDKLETTNKDKKNACWNTSYAAYDGLSYFRPSQKQLVLCREGYIRSYKKQAIATWIEKHSAVMTEIKTEEAIEAWKANTQKVREKWEKNKELVEEKVNLAKESWINKYATSMAEDFEERERENIIRRNIRLKR